MSELQGILFDVVEEIEGRRPELVVRGLEPDRVRLALPRPAELEHVVSIKPLLAQLRLQPGRRDALVSAFAITVLDAFARLEDPEDRGPQTDQLTTLIRTEEQVTSLRAFLRNHDPGNDVIAAPLCAPLQMVLAITDHRGGEPEALTKKVARTLGLDEPTLARLAFENLRARYRSVRRRPVEDMPGMHVTRAPLASSLLILADLFSGYAAMCRGDLLVVAPARDFLLYADSYTNGVLYDLRVLASNIQEFAPDPISDEVMKWTPAGFEPF